MLKSEKLQTVQAFEEIGLPQIIHCECATFCMKYMGAPAETFNSNIFYAINSQKQLPILHSINNIFGVCIATRSLFVIV